MNDLFTILQHIEKRPGMYFGYGDRSRSIRILQAFILGFQVSQHGLNTKNVFDCFTEWVALHYRVLADSMGGFDIILDRVGGDERKAYDEFFTLLPNYIRDRDQVGVDSIRLRFSEVQDDLWKAFREELKKH